MVYLETLEEQLESYTDEQKTNHLLAKIQPAMRQKLIEGGYTQRKMLRNDLIATVAMLEQNTLKKEGSASAKDKKKDQAKEGSGSSNPRHPRRSKDNSGWSDSSQKKTGNQSGGSDCRF